MWKKLSIKCLSYVFIIFGLAYETTGQSNAEKSGVCPEFTIPTSDLCVIECNKDSECPGDNKCCSLISCGSICTSPVVPTAVPKQVNVNNSTDSESNKCKNECDNSRQCGPGSLCIRNGCKRVCKSFSGKKKKRKSSNRKQSKDASPSSLLSQIPRRMRRRNCTDQCLRDVHCDFGYQCVPAGCRNACERDKSGANNILTPTMKTQADECNDRCVRDIHCPFGYECVHEGCRKICLKRSITLEKASSNVNTEVTRSSFSTSQRSSDCLQTCSRDSDCPHNNICAHHGCDTFCVQHPMASQSLLHASFSRSEQFGNQRAPEDCKSECVDDNDCKIGFYCRSRGCKLVCKQGRKNSNREQVAPERNKVQGSKSNCQNECNEDTDCGFGGYQCRQQGCKRVCRSDHQLRQRGSQTSSAHRCKNECETELDCPFGHFCAKKSCKNECKKSAFVTNTTPPQDCTKECVGTRNCNLGYICVKIGCKTACQKYQPSQNSQQGAKSKCMNECSRNSDCTAGNICVHDGCNKICSRNTGKSQEKKRQDKQGKQSPVLSNRCHDQCSKDSDCSSNSLCAHRGCRRVCISIFNSMSSGFTSPFSRNVRNKLS